MSCHRSHCNYVTKTGHIVIIKSCMHVIKIGLFSVRGDKLMLMKFPMLKRSQHCIP